MASTFAFITYAGSRPTLTVDSDREVSMDDIHDLHITAARDKIIFMNGLEKYIITVASDTITQDTVTITGNIAAKFTALKALFPKANGGTGGSALPTLAAGTLRNNGTTVTWSPDADLTYLSVTYAATISRAFDPLRPNLKMTLGNPGNLDFTLTGVPEGLGGEMVITRGSGGNETLTLNGTLITDAPTGSGVKVSMAYENQAGTVRWYCQNIISGAVESAVSKIAFLQANGITVTPPAPISITVDNTAKTATIVPPDGYDISLLESSADNGSTYQATSTGVRTVTGALPSGQFKARVAAGTLRNVGAVLASSNAFTVTLTALTGTPFSSPPYDSSGSVDAVKAFDDDVSTFFSAAYGTDISLGIDLGAAYSLTKVSLYPRSPYESRLQNATIEGSNTSESAGFTTLATITAVPTGGQYTDYAVSGSYRWVRVHQVSAGSFFDCSEMKVYGS